MTRRRVPGWAVVALVGEAALLALLASVRGLSAPGWLTASVVAVGAVLVLVRATSRAGMTGLGAANGVTLARTLLTAAVAALVAEAFAVGRTDHALTALAVLAVSLDAADGPVARRTGQVSSLGARFDMEADALLLAVLCLDLARSYGPWVLVIPALRYVFVAAGRLAPWLRAPLPRSTSRRLVAATSSVVAAVTTSALVPETVARIALALTLLALVGSFGRDVGWLAAHRPRTGPGQVDELD